jgi:FtsH-binding integral membrane protein
VGGEAMSLMAVAVILLFTIVVLLCVPQKRRPRTLGKLIFWSLFGLAICYLGPILFGFALLAFEKAKAHVILSAISLFVVILVVAIWIDRRAIRAIRAGSVEAFNEHIQSNMRNGYTHEKAFEIATRIRDGE